MRYAIFHLFTTKRFYVPVLLLSLLVVYMYMLPDSLEIASKHEEEAKTILIQNGRIIDSLKNDSAYKDTTMQIHLHTDKP